jgi:glycosyltransferase involved in cell wall biosynthesis
MEYHMEKLLSVIIPTYNMEALLPQCLDSLLVPQMVEALDVIIVNDGSDAEFSQIFEEISMLPGVTLLSQAEEDRESAMALAIDYYEAHLLPLGVSGGRTVLFENEEQAERVLHAAAEHSSFRKTAEKTNPAKRMMERILLAIRPVRIAPS